MVNFVRLTDSLKDKRPTHILGVCFLLPSEYEALSLFFNQIMNEMSNDTDRIVTSSYDDVDAYCNKMFA